MPDAGNLADASRRRSVTVAGHRGDATAARDALTDPEPAVRAAAVGAAARAGALGDLDLAAALRDGDPGVRRRAVEVAAAGGDWPGAAAAVRERLADDDPSVVEVAAWALGELGERSPLPAGTVDALASLATDHEDPLVREAAVAALGALGDPGGLPAILAATTDRPAVRRRAVLALASYEGPLVDAALERARTDRDWQVRDAAELLLRDD